MKCSEILCLILPFIVVLIVLSITDKEEIIEGAQVGGDTITSTIDGVKLNELPDEPDDTPKEHDFMTSLFCGFSGDYGCVERDKLELEEKQEKHKENVQTITIENDKLSDDLNERIESEKNKLCNIELKCQNGSECITSSNEHENGDNIEISAYCDCKDGYINKDCGTALDLCTRDNCGNGTPNEKYNNPENEKGCDCKCDDGWGEGGNPPLKCGKEYEKCTESDCGGNGTATGYKDDGEGCSCDCNDGYGGDICDTKYIPCDKVDCINGKVSGYRNDGVGCTCICHQGYEGDKCEKMLPLPWDKSSCTDDETCIKIRDNGSSKCIDDYYRTIDKTTNVPSCENCPRDSTNINTPLNKGGIILDNQQGSTALSDCICNEDNKYLDAASKKCEDCPIGTIKGKSIKLTVDDCICDNSIGWYEDPSGNTKCVRCGWDEDNNKLLPGFIFKDNKCICDTDNDYGPSTDGTKCIPQGKRSTGKGGLSKDDGTKKDNLSTYESKLWDASNDGDPQNICNGEASKSMLLSKLIEKDNDVRIDKDNNEYNNIGKKFISKITCKDGNCICPGGGFSPPDDNTLPCEKCNPTGTGKE